MIKYLLILLFTTKTFALVPNCLDIDNRILPNLNQQVIFWKHNTPDQTLKRALVSGTVVTVYPNQTGHTHFSLDIDSIFGGDIEIIYNNEFGQLPVLMSGMRILACGDYITVSSRAQRPSPMGAIIHWVHYNPGNRDNGLHKDGFLVIDSKVYGSKP
jgi:hypothetical protein